MNQEIDTFVKLLIEQVRDNAVHSCDAECSKDSNSPIAARWRASILNASDRELVRAVIPDIVDQVIFYLLFAIDSGALPLKYVAPDGDSVDLSAAGRGELAGWYMGDGGWREKYSKERYNNDCGDLTLE